MARWLTVRTTLVTPVSYPAMMATSWIAAAVSAPVRTVARGTASNRDAHISLHYSTIISVLISASRQQYTLRIHVLQYCICMNRYHPRTATAVRLYSTNQMWLSSPTACMLNTYKTDERSCLPCPTNSHTATAQAQMMEGCVCMDGYQGPNGGPCNGRSCVHVFWAGWPTYLCCSVMHSRHAHCVCYRYRWVLTWWSGSMWGPLWEQPGIIQMFMQHPGLWSQP